VRYWLDEDYDLLHPDLISAQRGALLELREHAEPLDKSGRWHRPSWPTRCFRQPKHWGLRGDPYLWFELHETMRLLPKPSGTDHFRLYIEVCLRYLAGDDILNPDQKTVHVERYPLKGMSGGSVCPPKWVEDLVPLLVDRFDTAP